MKMILSNQEFFKTKPFLFYKNRIFCHTSIEIDNRIISDDFGLSE